MEDQNQDSNLDKYTQQKVEKGIKELEEEKELKIKWRKEIGENEAFQLYLSKYNKASIESFIDQYISQKYFSYRYGDMYIRIAEKERSKWIDLAHEHLKPILQKQLFDLQCLWRAEEIKLEGVEKCIDFVKWEKEILNCPFLKPITKEDIKMYQDFLLKGNLEFSYHSMSEDWQNYDDIKELYQNNNDESEMPEWYEHHYTHTGTTNLLLLPDIRGEKEEFYRNIWFNNRQKETTEKQKNEPIPIRDERPYLSSYNKEVIQYLFKNFEDNETQTRYKYYSEQMEEGRDHTFYEDIFRELLEINEPIPVKESYDIKEAVHNAYNNYKARKTAEHLPLAYEQYLFNRKMGFVVKEKENHFAELGDIYTKSILGGRELNGEPRDFNF